MRQDPAGNLILAGISTSADLLATEGAQADARGDIFVQKRKADGSSVLWTARLGGAKDEAATAMTVDAKGDVYLTGWTASTDFPTSASAFQRFGQGGDDGFVTKLSGKDGSLVYSTLIGSPDGDYPAAISVDAAGVAAITGSTDSENFPTQAAASRSAFSAGPGAIITRLDAKGAALVSSTVLSGNSYVNGSGIVSLPDGTLLVAGNTAASDLVMVKSWQKTSQSAGIWRSGNAGLSWIHSADGARGVRGESMAIDPTNPQVLYVATLRGVFKSTDGGLTWAPSNSGMSASTAQYIAVDPKTPTNVYVATATGGLFRSTDGGASWTAANSGLGQSVWQVTIDPQTPTTLYATTNTNGIMKSTDSGDTWNPANNGIDYPYIIQVAVDPLTPANLYAAGYFGIYRSRDGGTSWTMLNAGPFDDIYQSITVDPTNPGTLYASTAFRGSIRSTDGGASWQAMRGGLSPYAVAFEFKAMAGAPGVVYAATTGGVYKSLNYGQTWSQLDEQLTILNVYGMALNPMDAKVVYVCSQLPSEIYLYHLDKDGQSILQSTYLGGDDDDEVNALAVDADGSVYLAGDTWSADFATTPGAPQTQHNGEWDAYLARLNATLSMLQFSTLFGGTTTDRATALAVESNGVVAVTGWSDSRDLLVTSTPADMPLGGNSDAFLARVSTQAPGFLLSTLIGGSGSESGQTVVSTTQGPLIAGYTTSRDMVGNLPALGANYLGGTSDGFVAGVSGLVAEAAWEQTSLTFDILLDGGPLTAEKKITVTSSAGALPLEAVVPTDTPWLQAVPNPDMAGELIVKVDAAGLEIGEYTAILQVSSPAAGVPATPVNVTLRVKNPTPPVVTAVLHKAEQTAQAIAPGLPILLQGDGFVFGDPPLPADPAADLPTTLADVSVTINGTPAVLESVQGNLISAIAPFDLTGDTATIVVTRGGLDSAPTTVPLSPTAPGLFTVDGTGQGQARAENEDGSTNTMDTPAEHGRPVILHAIGGGIMTPALADGQLVNDADHKPEATVEVFIDGRPCDVYYWGNTPGMTAGYLTLNLKVPDEVTPGPAVPVVLRIGGKDSTQPVTIAVH